MRDFYEESWRLVLLNTALSAYVLAVLALGAAVPLALVLILGAAGRRRDARLGGRDRRARPDRSRSSRRRRASPLLRPGSSSGAARRSRRARDPRRLPLLRRSRDARLAARGPRPLPRRDLRSSTRFCCGRSRSATGKTASRGRGRGRLRARAAGRGRRSGSGSGCCGQLRRLALAVLPFLTMTIAYSALVGRALHAAATIDRRGGRRWRTSSSSTSGSATTTRSPFEDFSLEIEDGEFIVLVGPSGCGKRPSLRMLAGLERRHERPHPDRRPRGQQRRARCARRRDGLPDRTRSIPT